MTKHEKLNTVFVTKAPVNSDVCLGRRLAYGGYFEEERLDPSKIRKVTVIQGLDYSPCTYEVRILMKDGTEICMSTKQARDIKKRGFHSYNKYSK